ncbi:MAG: adenylosuccinate synthetase [Desulfitibacter sp. BRH_c19]|nr:MAG: adenylosuccinate synthetase [Desulfitibacter sp. BRH_c19]
MSAVVLVGAQWGDEGKGKITDFLAEKADVICRYQGGNNAGHTVVVGNKTYKLHLIPSGILYPGKTCIIGSGVVLDPAILFKELEYLTENHIDSNSLKISTNAHLIMPYHRLLDELQEEKRGDFKIGTTKRGIGPCYMDKISRLGIRVIDVMDSEDFKGILGRNLEEKNFFLDKIYGHKGFDFNEMYENYLEYGQKMKPYLVDCSLQINTAHNEGKDILFEGAQGTLLDVDHGTYPFVTSSNPTSGGACIGSGIGPTKIKGVIGVVKAYTTRVGEGPFPTELNDTIGEQLLKAGQEFGTTTGRARRCGWFDAIILKYSVRINGISHLAITKLDVLDELDAIKICVGYKYNGELLKEFPQSLKKLADCEPVFETLPGWKQSISGLSDYKKLPPNAKRYIERIEELVKVKVSIVSTGPGREETMVIDKIF